MAGRTSRGKRGRGKLLGKLLLLLTVVFVILSMAIYFTPPIEIARGEPVYAEVGYSTVFYCPNILNATLYLQPIGSISQDIPVLAYVYSQNKTLIYQIATIRYISNITFYEDIGGTCIRLGPEYANISLNTEFRLLIKIPGYQLSPMPPSAIAGVGNGSYLLLYHEPGYSTVYMVLTIVISEPRIVIENKLGKPVEIEVYARRTDGSIESNHIVVEGYSGTSLVLRGNYTVVDTLIYSSIFFLKTRIANGTEILTLADNYIVILGILSIAYIIVLAMIIVKTRYMG
ncbi:hypothetical protein ACSU1N_01150 [Thermogladius sp. 4427co]|uniref:hypothetical protein n=1 Tax=Thermogladius sp. 4427co TaxID=3450718 RepID=UPI003F79B92D